VARKLGRYLLKFLAIKGFVSIHPLILEATRKDPFFVMM
jgi:hypothetical protein